MTSHGMRRALVVLTLLEVAPRAEAQLILDDFDVPEGYFASLAARLRPSCRIPAAP
jgi:hypothetical protein